MHRRHGDLNIPTEIVRSVVTIVETGSYSKAGEKLGLSQPAISAQIKRFQVLVGGPVFGRIAGGVTLTDRGAVVLGHARQMLKANDQILALGGAIHDSRNIRLGLSNIYVEQYLAAVADLDIKKQIHISSDQSAELARSFAEGYLDIVCLLAPPDDIDTIIVEWREKFVWVRRRDFVLSPGAPIPLVGSSGGVMDQPVTETLEKAGLAYRIVFSSTDLQVRLTAVAAGLGLMALPERQAAAPLHVATDYYLPPLPAARAAICVRPGFDLKHHDGIIQLLRGLAPDGEPLRVSRLAG